MIVGVCMCFLCYCCPFCTFFAVSLEQKNSNVQEREHDFSTFQDTDLRRRRKKTLLTKREDVNFSRCRMNTAKDAKKHEISLIFIYISPTSICMRVITI